MLIECIKGEKYNVRCVNGHETQKTFDHLSHQCLVCRNKSFAKTEDQVIADVERKGIYKVIKINHYNSMIDSSIDVMCLKCNNKRTNTADNLCSNESGCSVCYRISRCHDFETRQKIYSDENCTLVSKSYISPDDKQEFICSCGNIEFKTLKNFINHPRCTECSTKLTEATLMANYGVKNVGQLQASKDKAKITNKEKLDLNLHLSTQILKKE